MKNRQTTLRYSKLLTGVPSVTIAIPFYNQAAFLRRNVCSIIDHLEQPAELLMLDDRSTDESMEVLLNCLAALSDSQISRLTSIKVFQNPSARYETYCDAFLIEKSTAPCIIEIQADMQILQKGFDSKLMKALVSSPQLIAVSARGVEPLSGVIKSYSMTLGTDRAHSHSIAGYVISRLKYQIFTFLKKDAKNGSSTSRPQSIVPYTEAMDSEFLASGFAGRIASKINFPVDKDYAEKNIIFIGETIMRGPIILDREKYMTVGGFDTERFFQGYDEHEFFVKAFSLYGYRVGYTPVNFSSPLDEGSSRKKRSLAGEFQVLRHLLRIMSKRKSSTLWKLAKGQTIPEYQNEVISFN